MRKIHDWPFWKKKKSDRRHAAKYQCEDAFMPNELQFRTKFFQNKITFYTVSWSCYYHFGQSFFFCIWSFLSQKYKGTCTRRQLLRTKQQPSYTNILLTKQKIPEVRSEGNTYFIPAAQQQLTHQLWDISQMLVPNWFFSLILQTVV